MKKSLKIQTILLSVSALSVPLTFAEAQDAVNSDVNVSAIDHSADAKGYDEGTRYGRNDKNIAGDDRAAARSEDSSAATRSADADDYEESTRYGRNDKEIAGDDAATVRNEDVSAATNPRSAVINDGRSPGTYGQTSSAAEGAAGAERNPLRRQAADAKLSANLQARISDWPQAVQEEIQNLVQQHGEPQGITADRVVWTEPGNQFSEIIAYKKTVDHQFPTPHQDYLEHAVFYPVPEDKMDDLAAFDGSLIVYQTEGRLAARCHKAGANIAALNLAHKIITGEMTTDEARNAFAQAATEAAQGNTPELMSGLQFEPTSAERAADPGKALVRMN